VASKKEKTTAEEIELSEKVEHKKEDEKETIVDNSPFKEELEAKIKELEALLQEKGRSINQYAKIPRHLCRGIFSLSKKAPNRQNQAMTVWGFPYSAQKMRYSQFLRTPQERCPYAVA
jgi:hypothetical protein